MKNMVHVFNNEVEVARAMRATIYEQLQIEYQELSNLYSILAKDSRRTSCLVRIKKHKAQIESYEEVLKLSNKELLEKFSDCWGVL